MIASCRFWIVGLIEEKNQPVKSMGLDAVELVMATEEAFGVTLTNAEAEVAVTPGHLIDLVFGKLRCGDERVCLSQRAFYLLRKGLVTTLGVSRQSITPAVDIRLFLKGRLERETWYGLRKAVEARRWPALARPKWLVGWMWLVSISAFFVLFTVIHWAFAALVTVWIAFAVNQLTQEMRSRIPVGFCTVRSLVPYAMTSEAIAWRRDQVAAKVRKLVIEQLGLKEGEYREDAHFIKDLGMD